MASAGEHGLGNGDSASHVFPAGTRTFSAFALRQWRLVLWISGSHTHRMEGIRNMLITAEISAPRASMTQMELMISIS